MAPIKPSISGSGAKAPTTHRPGRNRGVAIRMRTSTTLHTVDSTRRIFGVIGRNNTAVSAKTIFEGLQRAANAALPDGSVWECTFSEATAINKEANSRVNNYFDGAVGSAIPASVPTPVGTGELAPPAAQQEDTGYDSETFVEADSPPCTDDEEEEPTPPATPEDMGSVASLPDHIDEFLFPPVEVKDGPVAVAPAPVARLPRPAPKPRPTMTLLVPAATSNDSSASGSKAEVTVTEATKAKAKTKTKTKAKARPRTSASTSKMPWNERIAHVLEHHHIFGDTTENDSNWLLVSEIADRIAKEWPEFVAAQKTEWRAVVSAIASKNTRGLWESKPFVTKHGKTTKWRVYRATFNYPALAPRGPRFRNVGTLPGNWVQDGTTTSPTGRRLPYYRTTSPRTSAGGVSKLAKKPPAVDKPRKIIVQKQEAPSAKRTYRKRLTETEKLLKDTESERERDEGFASITAIEQAAARKYAAKHFG